MLRTRRRWATALLGIAFSVTSASCKRRPPAPERVVEVEGTVFDAASDATHIYFLVWNGKGLIARIPIGGSAIEVLVEDSESPRHIALTADNIYWTTEQNLKRVPKSGGKPALIAAHVLGTPIAVDGRDVYSFESMPSGRERIVAHSLDGTESPTRVVAEEAHGHSIAVDNEAVYTSSEYGGDVERIPKAGGGNATVLAKKRFGGPLLLVGDDVYYCDDALYRVSKKGGEPRRVNARCGDRLAILEGVVYASVESVSSSSMGLVGHEDGFVRSLAPGSRQQNLFEGSSASGLVAAGGALYVAGRTKAQEQTAWLRLRVAK